MKTYTKEEFLRLGVEWIKETTSPSNVNLDKEETGNSAQIGSSGYYAKISSSSDDEKIGSSGYFVQIGSSGNGTQIVSSSETAKIGSSGDDAKISSSGDYCVICCAGENSIAKAKKGSWITLTEWRYNGSINRMIPTCVKTEFVDGKIIKEDTWYKLKNGNFVAVKI